METNKATEQEQSSSLERYIPILTWLPRYQREWLRADLITGVIVWGSTVPIAMGYAQMAGLPVQTGLYAALVALLAYAVFGSSSVLKVVPSSSMAIMSAAIVAPLALANYSYYVTLSAALALVVGVLLIAAGLARLGFMADFLAKPVVAGYLMGLALIVIISRLPRLFGLEPGTGTALEQLWQLITSLGDTNPWTLVVGTASLLLLLLFRRYLPRLPGTIIVMALGTLAVWALDLVQKGVEIVGPIPTGLPALQIPLMRPGDLLYLLLGATAMVFVALGESLGGARTFAAERKQHIDTDQELLALGAANLSAGLFQGFAVGANPSATSAANNSRARTQLASVVTALMLFFTLVTRPGFLGFLPLAVLAAAVIMSVSHLLNHHELRRFYRSRRIDFVLAIVALLGVLFMGILPGLMVAVFLSLLIVLYQTSRPHIAVLGKLPHHNAYGDIEQNPDAEQIPGLLIVRPDVPLYFANASEAHRQITSLISNNEQTIDVLIVDLGASADLDIACTDMLMNLVEELRDLEIRFLIADAKNTTRDRLEHTGLLELVGEGNIYLRVPEAVADLTRKNNSS